MVTGKVSKHTYKLLACNNKVESLLPPAYFKENILWTLHMLNRFFFFFFLRKENAKVEF